ncbi:signal peptidase I [Bacillus cereus]
MRGYAVIKNWAKYIVISLIITIVLQIFVVQPFRVKGESMNPTLHDEQWVLVSKWSHVLGNVPAYGSIVVLDSQLDEQHNMWNDLLETNIGPLFVENSSVNYIKRVIGKPGDTISYKNGVLYRNGNKIQEPYLYEKMSEQENQTWRVPAGHLFVLGDNRNNSKDSRMIGYIPLDHILGVAHDF